MHADILAPAKAVAFADNGWTRTGSSDRAGRLHRRIRHRTDTVGILPIRRAIVRLTGASFSPEQTDEGVEGRRCL